MTPAVFLPERHEPATLAPPQTTRKTDSELKSVSPDKQVVAKATEVSTQTVAEPKASSGGSVESIVRHAASKNGVDEEYFLKIAKCESTLRPDAVNPQPVIINGVNYGHAKGVFQFLDSTWQRMSGQAGYAGASVFDVEANINVAAWAFAHGHQDEWECKG